MRASDADRERVAAVLRRHYGAGRLDDDELERRLAKVLGAQTLGQLRNQVADLPAQPPSTAHRMANGLLYTGRALRHPLGIALSVFAALAVIGAIAGTAERNSRSDGSAASAPVPTVPTSTGTPYAYNPPAEHITHLGAGDTGVDDGLAMRVRRISRRASVASTWSDESRLYPKPGHVFAVVDVDYTNRRSTTVEPFCVGGAKLYSRSHRGYEPFERTYHAAGNRSLCGGGIEPEETATAHLLFDVTPGTHFKFVDLYNSDDKGGDDLGNTRLRVSLDGVPGA
jgi:Domain of unknown function (DUF1707)